MKFHVRDDGKFRRGSGAFHGENAFFFGVSTSWHQLAFADGSYFIQARFTTPWYLRIFILLLRIYEFNGMRNKVVSRFVRLIQDYWYG